MYKKLKLGVVPVKRGSLSMERARGQKERYLERIRGLMPEFVELTDIEDVCENGVAYKPEDVEPAVGKLKAAGIEALFIPFCDFGEEEVAARIAAAMKLPVLVWGARDERPNTIESRGRDTQCGMFAATKVMRRYNVKYSYIYNVPLDSEEFMQGYDRFIRVSTVLRDLSNLRIAKIGARPRNFVSVMTNEANLIQRFGMSVVPISPALIGQKVEAFLKENGEELRACCKELRSRFDGSQEQNDSFGKVAATRLVVEQLMLQANCSVAAFECWPAFVPMMGICPCAALGEMADLGLPMACETDVNGAVTMAILRACSLHKEAGFLADLTIRHPENDNGELLWHCGAFPYSLKAPESRAKIIDGRGAFELKQGALTVCRLDEVDGKYYLFAGEAKTTTGPETTHTYVWMEVDQWKRWEEKLIFGPYIHHVGVLYGKYLPVLREVARYLDLEFDSAHEQGLHSL